MTGSHEATPRQYRLPNLCLCGQPRNSSSSGTAWSATGSSRRCGPATPIHLRITVLAEETDAAYDRVGLTSYTGTGTAALLALPGNDYDGDERVRLILEHAVAEIDRAGKQWHRRRETGRLRRAGVGDRVLRVRPTGAGTRPAWRACVPDAGRPRQHPRCRADTRRNGLTRSGVVIGGGLLGLEAANALSSSG